MNFEKMPKVYVGDNEELHKIIISIYNMAQISRREGLLALELQRDSVFEDLKCDEIKIFGRQMLEFILEAFDNSDLKELAQGFIAQSTLGDEDLLCLMIVAEGLLRMQEGEAGEFLVKKILFMLGYKNQKAIYEKVLMDFRENFSLANFCETNLTAAAEKKKEISKDELGMEELMKLSDEELCNLIDDFSIEEWAIAMKTAEVNVQSRIFGLVSKIQASTMKNLMEFTGPVRLTDIEQVQQKIMEKIEQKEN